VIIVYEVTGHAQNPLDTFRRNFGIDVCMYMWVSMCVCNAMITSKSISGACVMGIIIIIIITVGHLCSSRQSAGCTARITRPQRSI